jgi:hypothetical protein
MNTDKTKSFLIGVHRRSSAANNVLASARGGLILVPRLREVRDSDLLRSWNWDEPGGGAKLQPSPEGTQDFSPPAAGLRSLAGGRAEGRRRLKSAPPSKRSPASGGPKWLTLFPRANRNCGRHQESRDSSRPTRGEASSVPERRDERPFRRAPRRQECLRRIVALEHLIARSGFGPKSFSRPAGNCGANLGVGNR